MAITTVGQTTTTTRSFDRDTERKANRGIYWALGLAVLVVLAIIVARNYSMRPAAVTTPADTSSVAPPVNNGIGNGMNNGVNANGVGTDSSQTMPGNGTDTYGTTPVAPDASSTTAPVAPAAEPTVQ